MKPYGVPRDPDFQGGPDVGTIKTYGMKSSTGKFPEKGGDFKPYIRSPEARRAARRTWKKAERVQARRDASGRCEDTGE